MFAVGKLELNAPPRTLAISSGFNNRPCSFVSLALSPYLRLKRGVGPAGGGPRDSAAIARTAVGCGIARRLPQGACCRSKGEREQLRTSRHQAGSAHPSKCRPSSNLPSGLIAAPFTPNAYFDGRPWASEHAPVKLTTPRTRLMSSFPQRLIEEIGSVPIPHYRVRKR